MAGARQPHLLSNAVREEIREIVREEVAKAEAARLGAPTRLLSIKTVAAALSLSRTKVYNEIGAGRLRSLRVGGRRLIPEDAVAEYIASLSEAG